MWPSLQSTNNCSWEGGRRGKAGGAGRTSSRPTCVLVLFLLLPLSFVLGPLVNFPGGADAQAVGLTNQRNAPPAPPSTHQQQSGPGGISPLNTYPPYYYTTVASSGGSGGIPHWSSSSFSSSGGSSSGVGTTAGTGTSSSSNGNNNDSGAPTTAFPPVVHKNSNYTLIQMIVIAWVAGCLGLMTVVGNILVMVSFKIDKQLQTISNYFLFSLAVADFIIGLISMPLFTVYLLMGQWPFGPTICDAWLALDYLASNASVLNLLIISFDRYFSVTRPLTYRARRTTRRAAVMISSAWGISLILWPPWIYAWPYIEGSRSVPDDECYIQFIVTNQWVTFGTAIAAFYVPVSIMLVLYWQIWRETEKRQRDLSQLQAGKKDSSRRSNSSDEAVDVEEWKRMRSESCICQDHLDQVPSCPAHRRQSRLPRWLHHRWRCILRLYESFGRFCRVDRDQDDVEDGEDEHASPGCGTPASIETPLQSSVSRCTSLNVIRDPLAQTPTRRTDSVVSPLQQPQQQTTSVGGAPGGITTGVAGGAVGATAGAHTATTTTTTVTATATSLSLTNHPATQPPPGSNGKLPGSDSVYTILIRIPGETEAGKNASIRMIQEPGPLPPLPVHPKAKMVSSNPEHGGPGSPMGSISGAAGGTGPASGGGGGGGPVGRRTSTAVPTVNSKLVSKSLSGGKGGSTTTLSGASTTTTTVVPVVAKRKKKKNQEKKQEKKAAKTLSAILLAFIVTWTPYNILVLLRTVLSDDDPIPSVIWDMAYYLCYINSTINPMCYALCNASFRRTYVRILTCKWDNSRRQAVNRGYYN